MVKVVIDFSQQGMPSPALVTDTQPLHVLSNTQVVELANNLMQIAQLCEQMKAPAPVKDNVTDMGPFLKAKEAPPVAPFRFEPEI